MMSNHLFYYPTPSHLNYTRSFGSLVGLVFAVFVVTFIFTYKVQLLFWEVDFSNHEILFGDFSYLNAEESAWERNVRLQKYKRAKRNTQKDLVVYQEPRISPFTQFFRAAFVWFWSHKTYVVLVTGLIPFGCYYADLIPIRIVIHVGTVRFLFLYAAAVALFLAPLFLLLLIFASNARLSRKLLLTLTVILVYASVTYWVFDLSTVAVNWNRAAGLQNGFLNDTVYESSRMTVKRCYDAELARKLACQYVDYRLNNISFLSGELRSTLLHAVDEQTQFQRAVTLLMTNRNGSAFEVLSTLVEEMVSPYRPVEKLTPLPDLTWFERKTCQFFRIKKILWPISQDLVPSYCSRY